MWPIATTSGTPADFHLLEATIDDFHAALRSGRTTCRELVELYLRRVYLSAIAGHEHPPDETVPLARHSLNVPGESSSLIFIPNENTKARAIDYCFLPRRRCQRPLAEASTARNALAVCFDTTLVLLDYLTIRRCRNSRRDLSFETQDYFRPLIRLTPE